MAGPAPYDIFLSYPGGSPEDSRNVFALGRALEDRGLRPWIGEREQGRLDPQGKEAIVELLNRVPIFICCFGNRSQQEWGQEEVAIAVRRAAWDPGFRICTVLLPGSRASQLDHQPPAVRAKVFDLREGLADIYPLIAFCLDGSPDLGWLVAKVADACRNGPGTVLLTGPPGSGKTRIAREAMRELADDFPAGRAMFAAEGMTPEQALAVVRKWLDGRGETTEVLEKSPYLVVFDDVNLEDASILALPRPSSAIVVSRGTPRLSIPHVKIDVEAQHSAMRTEPPEVRPGYTSDSPGDTDLLDIGQPVRALCSVIAAKDVKPPLSVGLFGEWGAGKTFFIEQMQRRIDDLASASMDAGDSAYCSSIKQIVFNAWHYADANLWASLAGRVFEGLGTVGKSQSARLFEKLESSQLQLQQAEAEERAAEERAREAEAEEEAAREDHASAQIELSDLRKTAAEALEEIEPGDDLLRELGETLRQPQPVALGAAKDLLTIRGALEQLFRRAWRTMVALGGLLALAVVLLLVFPETAVVAVALAPAALLALRLLAGPARWIAKARAEARGRAETLRRQRNLELKERLERSQQERSEAHRRHQAARHEADEARREIDQIRNGDRLFEFISERSQVSAYGPYQGVIAVVRRDFEVLADLIAEHTREDDGLPRIERIVLYIDDLDRCPAPRVVEVLEAVHLLMASKLFVVVVAVDPRWLLSSLRRRYANEMNVDGEGLWAPTPEDYMEKIFQIPFSLPQMEDEGYGRMIESLMPLAADRDGEETLDPPDTPVADDGPDAATGSPQLALRTTDPTAPIEAIELRPAGLRITRAEIEFLSQLRPLARTPRSAKRLANLYRLFRAALTSQQLDDLLETEPAQFRCVQVLLAIVVGFPALAPRLFREVTDGSHSSWWGLMEDWRPPDQEAGRQFLLEAMEPLRKHPLPDLYCFASWAPLVARYSYGALPVATPGAQ